AARAPPGVRRDATVAKQGQDTDAEENQGGRGGDGRGEESMSGPIRVQVIARDLALVINPKGDSAAGTGEVDGQVVPGRVEEKAVRVGPCVDVIPDDLATVIDPCRHGAERAGEEHRPVAAAVSQESYGEALASKPSNDLIPVVHSHSVKIGQSQSVQIGVGGPFQQEGVPTGAIDKIAHDGA